MKDVSGKLLSVGDRVAFIPQDGYTASLSIGVISSFTPKKVKITMPNKKWSDSPNTCLKFPDQVSKIEI